MAVAEEKDWNDRSSHDPLNVDRVLRLLTSRHSCDMAERHYRALDRLIARNERGFHVRETLALGKLIRAAASATYDNYIQKIVQICGKTFVRDKASDELLYKSETVGVLLEIGNLLLHSVCVFVHQSVAIAVRKIFNNVPSTGSEQRTTFAFNVQIIEESRVTEALIRCLEKTTDTNVTGDILKTLKVLSVSVRNCDQIISNNGARTVCLLLKEKKHSALAVDTLWNLFEYSGNKQVVASQLSSFTCIRCICDSFRALVHARSQSEKESRNDVAVIAHYVSSFCDEAPFVETGFVALLASTFTETKTMNPISRNLKLTSCHEDFEFKKLMMSLMVTFRENAAALHVMRDHFVLLSLFSFVKPNDKASDQWTPAQFEELQLLALSCLSSLCRTCKETYVTCQGSTRLLLLLEWAASKEERWKSQIQLSLHVLLSVVALRDETIIGELSDQGAIEQFVYILSRSIVSSAVDVDITTSLLLILSHLCDNDLHRKELFGMNGVEALVPFVKVPLQWFDSGLGHYRLVLATIDVCWCCVVGSSLTEDAFLEYEGIFLLLDLLELCSNNMQSLVLGCVLDLCENPKSLSHVLTWRGSTGTTNIYQLLLRLWKEEEKALGMARTCDGVLSDVANPLRGQSFRPESSQQKVGSLAIVDVVGNMRAKIWALFSKIGFGDDQNARLSIEDRITVELAKEFMNLKVGEIWLEIDRELNEEGVDVTPFDKECIEEIKQWTRNKTEQLIERQKTVLSQRSLAIDDEERIYYTKIKKSHEMSDKASDDWMQFLERTSDMSALLKAREDQLEVILASKSRRETHPHKKRTHATHQVSLKTTTFSGRQVSVKTSIVPPLPAVGERKEEGGTRKRELVTV